MTVAINRTPGDSDTVAKMVGELLGLQYGYENIVPLFKKHGLNFEQEVTLMEDIQDLQEYFQHFPLFAKQGIKSFHDLAKTIASKKLSIQSVPEFILAIGDMMQLPVDCIVNPANSNIQGGGGVDGIITANINPATGKQCIPPVGDTSGTILQELAELKRLKKYPIDQQGQLPEGEAVITSSGNIINQNAKTIKYVISTVGPKGPNATEEKNRKLYKAYDNSIRIAGETSDIKTIAFPSISTGIFNYPVQEAAKAAIYGCLDRFQYCKEYNRMNLNKVYLILLPTKNKKDFEILNAYKDELKNLNTKHY